MLITQLCCCPSPDLRDRRTGPQAIQTLEQEDRGDREEDVVRFPTFPFFLFLRPIGSRHAELDQPQ
jgi:hypothetical protein